MHQNLKKKILPFQENGILEVSFADENYGNIRLSHFVIIFLKKTEPVLISDSRVKKIR